jgi:hypothetical protein
MQDSGQIRPFSGTIPKMSPRPLVWDVCLCESTPPHVFSRRFLMQRFVGISVAAVAAFSLFTASASAGHCHRGHRNHGGGCGTSCCAPVTSCCQQAPCYQPAPCAQPAPCYQPAPYGQVRHHAMVTTSGCNSCSQGYAPVMSGCSSCGTCR